MVWDVKIIEYVLKTTPTAEEAAEKLSSFETIRARVDERKRRIQQIQKRAEREIEQLKSTVLCEHELQRTQGDPSGGSDGSTECLICGEIIHERPVRFT